MKLVTDAQLAALRAEVADHYGRQLQAALAQARADSAAELARLREDRAAELARVVDPAQPFVTHLREEVAVWRLLYQAERQRNDVATDQRLAERGLGGITRPTQALTPEGPTALDEFLRANELGRIGDPEGVER